MKRYSALVIVDSFSTLGILVSTRKDPEGSYLSDKVSNPSPRPSPGGRGRSSSETCLRTFVVERSSRWVLFGRSHPQRVLRPPHVSQLPIGKKKLGAVLYPCCPQKTFGQLTRNPKSPARSQAGAHPAKEMHVSVTLLDRPLPPGEGRGEGLLARSDNSKCCGWRIRSHAFPRFC
jgi:hypothetical protein